MIAYPKMNAEERKAEYARLQKEFEDLKAMGLKLKGSVVQKVYSAECVCGWSTAAVGRYVTTMSGVILSAAHPGDFTVDDNHIPLISAFQEGQVVHRSCSYIAHGMPLGHDAGHLVDPLHQNAAEETVGTVEMVGAHDMHGFCPGFIHSFR
jgi:hypothetical protein